MIVQCEWLVRGCVGGRLAWWQNQCGRIGGWLRCGIPEPVGQVVDCPAAWKTRFRRFSVAFDGGFCIDLACCHYWGRFRFRFRVGSLIRPQPGQGGVLQRGFIRLAHALKRLRVVLRAVAFDAAEVAALDNAQVTGGGNAKGAPSSSWPSADHCAPVHPSPLQALCARAQWWAGPGLATRSQSAARGCQTRGARCPAVPRAAARRGPGW